jgi:hypothetical protein
MPAPARPALWTVKDLERLFRRTYPTLYLWRLHFGLPAYVEDGKVVGYVPEEVIRWARLTGRILYQRDEPEPLPHVPMKRSRAPAETTHVEQN